VGLPVGLYGWRLSEGLDKGMPKQECTYERGIAIPEGIRELTSTPLGQGLFYRVERLESPPRIERCQALIGRA